LNKTVRPGLAPELHRDPYVFVVADAIPAGLLPFAVIRGDEALALIGAL
jgi:hypothetical protein